MPDIPSTPTPIVRELVPTVNGFTGGHADPDNFFQDMLVSNGTGYHTNDITAHAGSGIGVTFGSASSLMLAASEMLATSQGLAAGVASTPLVVVPAAVGLLAAVGIQQLFNDGKDSTDVILAQNPDGTAVRHWVGWDDDRFLVIHAPLGIDADAVGTPDGAIFNRDGVMLVPPSDGEVTGAKDGEVIGYRYDENGNLVNTGVVGGVTITWIPGSMLRDPH